MKLTFLYILTFAFILSCSSDKSEEHDNEYEEHSDYDNVECSDATISSETFFRENHCGSNSDCEQEKICLGGICAEKIIRTYDLIVEKDQWDEMRINGRYERMEIPCSLKYGGQTYSDCFVRPRGESSLDYKKLPLRIQFPENYPHPGYSRKINLRSEYNDRSFLRMILAHETFRSLTRVPSPRTRFVNLSVNGNPNWGLYVEIERVGGNFLELNGRNRALPMYEADPEIDLLGTGICSLIPLESTTLYRSGYIKKTGDEENYLDLINLIENDIYKTYLTGDSCYLHDAVNMEMFLDYLAVMGLIQGKDHVRKNYFFSKQKDRNGELKWEFYAWDLDLTFGCIYTDEDLTICNELFTEENPFFGMRSENEEIEYPAEEIYNLLIDLVLRDPYLKQQLSNRICTMMDSDYWQKRIFDIIDAYEQHILPKVQEDGWDRNETTEEFENGVEEVRQFIKKRTEYIIKLLDCE